MPEQELNVEELAEELREYLDYDAAHKIERLIHTHIGGPMTTLFTQLEVTKIIMKRDPDKLEEEMAKVKDSLKAASTNINTIVRALAMASRDKDEEDEG